MEPGGGAIIRATFVTRIDHPADAIDSHGRFVGDILVGTGVGLSINTWLVAQGWAFPLLYDSMTDAEVKTIITAWKVGRTRTSRPGKSFQKPLQPFDPTKNVGNAKLPDRGRLNFPKIFRRQATFWATVAGPLSPAQFVTLLRKGQAGKPDTAYLPGVFPQQHRSSQSEEAGQTDRSDWISGADALQAGRPGVSVRSSTLRKANGKEVKRW